MIEGLLIALLYVAVIMVIGWVIVVILRQVPGLPAIVPTIVWAICAILAILLLVRVLVSGGLVLP